jgi:hypothetical protein
MEDLQISQTHTGQGERALWIAVVLRAICDITHEPPGTQEYNEAAAFFIGGGNWALSRAAVAGHIDLHPDDLRRCGRRCISDRRVAKINVNQPAPHQETTPLPRQVVKPRLKPATLERIKRDKNWWIAKFMAERKAPPDRH